MAAVAAWGPCGEGSTRWGRGDAAEPPASHRVFREGDCMGKLRTLVGSWDLQELSLKCAHIYLSQLLNRWCQNYNL